MEWDGEELPLRSAQARLAVEPVYGRRDALGRAALEVSAGFNEERRDLLADRNELEGEVSGSPTRWPATRTRRGVALRPILDAVDVARVRARRRGSARAHWLDRLLGPERDETPGQAHNRLDPPTLAPRGDIYEERSVEVCLATLQAMGFDLDAEQGIRPTSRTGPRSRRAHA